MNPSSPVDKPIRIIQITDFHLLADPGQTMLGVNTEQSFLEVLGHVRRKHQGIDLYLMTGDLVQDPTVATYERLGNRLKMLNLPCYCLPGNHDSPKLIRQVLAKGNIHFVPQILLDGWQLICLDSTIPFDSGGHLTQGQLNLLEAKLADLPQHFALICLHHSPLPTGADWLDTMKLSNSDEFFALIKRFPQVKGVLYGHIHQAMDVEFKGLHLLGCPSTCFQFKPNSKNFALDNIPQGYRCIELHPDGGITTKLVRLNTVPSGLDMSSNGY